MVGESHQPFSLRREDCVGQLGEELRRLLNDVNEWLRFAESKNAVIIGLNGAAIFGLVSTFPHMFGGPGLVSRLGTWLVVMLALSTIASLLSFLPRLELTRTRKSSRTGTPVNLLYFGTIATLEPDDLISGLSAIEGLHTESLSSLHWQYAEQIVNNSRIALTKYRFFTLAVWIDLFGIAPPVAVIALLVAILRRGRNR